MKRTLALRPQNPWPSNDLSSLLRVAAGRPGWVRHKVEAAVRRLPPVLGDAIHIAFRPSLTVYRNILLSNEERGEAVHAAAFLPTRRIVLESVLLDDGAELSRILVHELFHFVWARLGNPARREWEDVLSSEWRRHARGELGWSAESRKQSLKPLDYSNRTRRWREYVCESFCDTAAWLYSTGGEHPEHTLAPYFREKRRRCLEASLLSEPIPL